MKQSCSRCNAEQASRVAHRYCRAISVPRAVLLQHLESLAGYQEDDSPQRLVLIIISFRAQMVEQEYAELFPGEVEAVHVVYDLAALNGLCKEYDTLKRNLEDLVDDYTSKKRRHKPIKRKQVRDPLSTCTVARFVYFLEKSRPSAPVEWSSLKPSLLMWASKYGKMLLHADVLFANNEMLNL